MQMFLSSQHQAVCYPSSSSRRCRGRLLLMCGNGLGYNFIISDLVSEIHPPPSLSPLIFHDPPSPTITHREERRVRPPRHHGRKQRRVAGECQCYAKLSSQFMREAHRQTTDTAPRVPRALIIAAAAPLASHARNFGDEFRRK